MNENKLDTRPSKEEFFMTIAEAVRERSTCKRLKVGAIVTNWEMTQIVSMGYNGNYAGGPNECDSDEPGNCGCIHAEVNCLIKPRPDRSSQIMFVTDAPCIKCAKLIINAGIRDVYYRNEYRLTEGVDLLKDNDVVVSQI